MTKMKFFFRIITIKSLVLLLIATSLPLLLLLSTPKPVSAVNTCADVYAPLPAWLVSAINTNKAAYISVSNSTNVPWEMLAAIHYRETSFSRTNPGNGQGIFQFVNGDGGPYPPGPVSEAEFMRQLTFMANRVQNDYVFRGTLPYTHRKLTKNETDDFRVQDTLYSYNGRSSQYAQQGAQYGFNTTNQPYQGSPYVMNMFDCPRANMGLITKDYGSIDGIDTRYGAFTLYARLKGDQYWQSRHDFLASGTPLQLPGCHEATNTTLSCIWLLRRLGTNTPALAHTNAERDKMVSYGYRLSGTEFFANVAIAPKPGNIPVYALKRADGTFLYTADQNERTVLITHHGYQDGGIAFYADRAGANSGFPVYRLYNPNTGLHIWTISSSKKESYRQQGYTAEGGVVFNSISSVRQEKSPPVGQKLVYRFSSMPGNSHFWTTDVNERDSMIRAKYRYEGVAWNVAEGQTSVPVYRLYSPTMLKHLYTTDANERNILRSTSSWRDEGVAYYASPSQTGKPIYRLYSPITTNHLLTSDAYERGVLIAAGTFRDEGIAYYSY